MKPLKLVQVTVELAGQVRFVSLYLVQGRGVGQQVFAPIFFHTHARDPLFLVAVDPFRAGLFGKCPQESVKGLTMLIAQTPSKLPNQPHSPCFRRC